MTTYRIAAHISATETAGYSVYDYFRGTDYEGDILDRDFATKREAEQAAEDAYKGPDVDGIGCHWEIDYSTEL